MKIEIVTVDDKPRSRDIIDQFPLGTMIDQVSFYQNMGLYKKQANWYKIWLKNHNICSIDLFVPLNEKFKPFKGQWYKIKVNNYSTILEMEPTISPICCIIM